MALWPIIERHGQFFLTPVVTMCGRYTLRNKLNLVLAQSAAQMADAGEWGPAYNIAPTQIVPAVRLEESGKRQAALLKW